MSRSLTLLWFVAVIAGGAALVAAQQSTRTPGEPTQARVWIENRGPGDAVPVSVERFASTPSVHLSSIDASVVLPSRAARQQWEYRIAAIDPGSLTAAGNEGWEAVGVVTSSVTPTVLLKRPR